MAIIDKLLKCSEAQLIECLPYIRDENGERVTLAEFKAYLREERQKRREQPRESQNRTL